MRAWRCATQTRCARRMPHMPACRAGVFLYIALGAFLNVALPDEPAAHAELLREVGMGCLALQRWRSGAGVESLR